MSGSKKRTTDAVEIMDRWFRDKVPNWDEEVREEYLRVRVGIAIGKMREEAGITHRLRGTR